MSDHKQVRSYWDKNADHWFFCSEKGFDIWRDHVNMPAFLRMLPDVSGKIGADIGCGDAYNSRIIAQRCKSIYAVDFCERFLTLSQKTSNPPNIAYCNANAAALPFRDEYFDFIISIMFLMDTADIDKILAEVYRVLSLSGFF